MNVLMLLADSAQVSEGKLYILGGGWTLTGPYPAPQALAIKFIVDSHELNVAHHWEVVLEDADGRPIIVDTPDGPQPVEVRGDFQAGEPEGALPGTPVDVPIAINFGPLPLAPASRFVWRVVIDGVTPPGGISAFSTRPLSE
jgi:hypothetical protein